MVPKATKRRRVTRAMMLVRHHHLSQQVARVQVTVTKIESLLANIHQLEVRAMHMLSQVVGKLTNQAEEIEDISTVTDSVERLIDSFVSMTMTLRDQLGMAIASGDRKQLQAVFFQAGVNLTVVQKQWIELTAVRKRQRNHKPRLGWRERKDK
jgi:phage gp29-like protein